MLVEMGSALASARSLVDLAKSAIDARDDAKVRSALIELQAKLMDAMSAALLAQEKNASLHQQVTSLQGQVQDLKLQLENRQRYRLTPICPGAYAYTDAPGQSGQDAHAHYLCQPCFDKGAKSVLRYSHPKPGVNGAWTCPESSAHRIEHPNSAGPLPKPPGPVVL